jgi:hypothetical protein
MDCILYPEYKRRPYFGAAWRLEPDLFLNETNNAIQVRKIQFAIASHFFDRAPPDRFFILSGVIPDPDDK